MLKLCKKCDDYTDTEEKFCRKCGSELENIQMPVKLNIERHSFGLSWLALLGWGIIPLFVYGYKSKMKIAINVASEIMKDALDRMKHEYETRKFKNASK